MVHLKCGVCGHEWKMKYWMWILNAPIHLFKFSEWKDYRLIKCPNCKNKIWSKKV